MFTDLDLIDTLINSNQNNHRLTHLKDFDKLPSEAQQDITKLLNSVTDRTHHALGVLLWALISKDTAVAVVSCRDLDELILEAAPRLTEGVFSVRSSRAANVPVGKRTITVWAQLTAVLINNDIVEILKPQKGQVPAVIELVHPSLLRHIQTKATDDFRVMVVNSTSKIKFSTFENFKASIHQSFNTTRPQGLDTSTLQYSNTTSSFVTQNVTQNKSREFKLDDCVKCINPEVGLNLDRTYYVSRLYPYREELFVEDDGPYRFSDFKLVRRNE